MVADAAGLPVEGEESFTLLPEQFRPLYPVCEAHTSGNKRLTHPDRPVGRLCLMFMFLSELLQLPKQIQLILFNIDVSFLLFVSSLDCLSSDRLFPKASVKLS